MTENQSMPFTFLRGCISLILHDFGGRRRDGLQATQHHVRTRKNDPRRTGIRVMRIILTQDAITSSPCDRSLHRPSLGNDDNAALFMGAYPDLEVTWAVQLHPRSQVAPLDPSAKPVRRDGTRRVATVKTCMAPTLSASAVACPPHHQQQSECIA